ncbi:gliding motility-associated C-terminal domain-containing protein [Flavobacteriaceae bacterium]|nr:gliding motility-associated C-terminal domain-containing protein [Flavobacteriaceae bacterium]
MPQNCKITRLLFLLIPCIFYGAQLSVFGDLYIGNGKEVHVAFKETYFSGGQIITERKEKKGVLSFGKESEWKQLQENSFVDGIVRIYHVGDFIFPVGEHNLFSPLALFLKSNENFIEVQYQRNSTFLSLSKNNRFEAPQQHIWSWKTDGISEGIVQLYWTQNHQLQQLSYYHLEPKTLHLGILNSGFWEPTSTHFSHNQFFEDTPLSVDFGSARTLDPVNLNQYQAVTFLIEKEPLLTTKLISQVITPNGDGINDTWKISGYRFTERSRIFIYNHGREQVYHFEGLYQNDWDGSSEITGESISPGSYFYTIDWDGDFVIDRQGWIYIKSN